MSENFNCPSKSIHLTWGTQQDGTSQTPLLPYTAVASGRGQALRSTMADLEDTILQHAFLCDLSPQVMEAHGGDALVMKKAHEGRTLGS